VADETWYRRRTWTDEDQSAFFAKLRRSRSGFHKAQYCRIQAYELQQAGNYGAALQLLNFLITGWPNDAQEAAVFQQQAECLEKLGDKTAALDAYRRVFDTQRRKRNSQTTAHLGFGLLIALSPDPELYDEALSVLDEFGSSRSLTFPIEEFKAAAIRALIADAKGSRDEASRQAELALTAAGKTHSGLPRHAKLGLVTTIQSNLEDRIKGIASRPDE